MYNRVKSVLTNLASEWKKFAQETCLSDRTINSIDLDDISDELKLELILEKLYDWYPSCFMIEIKKALTVIGKSDILNEIKLLGK